MEYGATSWIDKTRGLTLLVLLVDTSINCLSNTLATTKYYIYYELLQLFNNTRETFLTSLRGRGLYFKEQALYLGVLYKTS